MDQVVAPPTSLLTHIALPVRDLDATLAFYRKYTTLEIIHEREDPETKLKIGVAGQCRRQDRRRWRDRRAVGDVS